MKEMFPTINENVAPFFFRQFDFDPVRSLNFGQQIIDPVRNREDSLRPAQLSSPPALAEKTKKTIPSPKIEERSPRSTKHPGRAVVQDIPRGGRHLLKDRSECGVIVVFLC